MGNKIRVNTGSLSTTQNEMNTLLNNLSKELRDLQSAVSQMERMWSGTAASAFHNNITADMNQANSLITSMKTIPTKEGEAKKEYDSCEQKVAQIISSIRI